MMFLEFEFNFGPFLNVALQGFTPAAASQPPRSHPLSLLIGDSLLDFRTLRKRQSKGRGQRGCFSLVLMIS